jgi:thiol-disulfide isomerase/thioredoxin
MPPNRREVLVLGAAGLAAATAGAVLGPLALQSQSGAAELLSTAFPDLTGRPRRLSEWRGRVTMVNFWATWCEPCRDEVPLLLKIRQKYLHRGLEVVGIGIDNAPKMPQFASMYGISYPLLVGTWGHLRLLGRLANPGGALPYSLVLSRSGAIAYRKLGALREAELEAILPALLQ